MQNNNSVTNVVIAGLGGQGAIRVSDILSEAAFRAGYDVKKSEIHGMSQRGGSVSSDVRFGKKVLSPMVPEGQADFLLVLHPTQVENNRHHLNKESGVLITPAILLGEDETDLTKLNDLDDTPVNQRNFNVCLLGLMSTYFDIAEEYWLEAIFANLKKSVHEQNANVFAYGRTLRSK